MRTVGCIYAAFIALAALAASVSATPADSTVQFDMVGHVMVLKARINDSPDLYTFFIDTGGLTCLDKALADSLGLKQKGMAAKIDTLDLSGFIIDRVFCFTGFDLKRFRALGTPVHGIIGSNLLERYRVTLDFQTFSVTFSSDTTSLTAPPEGILLTFRNHQVNNAPLVNFKIGGDSLEGMIDTGQPYPLVLPLEVFEEYRDRHLIDYISSRGLMIEWPMTNADHNYLGRLDHFELGTVRADSLICLFGQLPQPLSMPLIGVELLSQFKVIINYPRDQMLLLPKEDVHLATNRFSAGFNLDLSDSGTAVAKGIWESSPAERAGIEVGDTILSFNGTGVTWTNLIELMEISRDDQVQSITLQVSHEGSLREVELKTRPLFTP